MFAKQQFKRLARSGYGIVGGVIAIGAAAAAAGAAPAALIPWSSSEPPAATAPTSTIAAEALVDGHPLIVVTTEVTPAPTAPTTSAPATSAAPIEPATTAAAEPTAVPEPTAPAVEVPAAPPTTTAAHNEPAHNEPAPTLPAQPAPTGQAATPDALAEPATSAAPLPEPAPSTPAAPISDNVVPGGLSLSCSAATTESGTDVSCDWSGAIPAGFAKFLLLRGNQTATGRVPFQSSDPTAHHFTDIALAQGSYTYVVVALNAAGTPLVHSNMVPITSPVG